MPCVGRIHKSRVHGSRTFDEYEPNLEFAWNIIWFNYVRANVYGAIHYNLTANRDYLCKYLNSEGCYHPYLSLSVIPELDYSVFRLCHHWILFNFILFPVVRILLNTLIWYWLAAFRSLYLFLHCKIDTTTHYYYK